MKLPRFSLRELFLLIVVAAMGCGWWVERARIHREREELTQERQEFASERDRFLILMRQAGLLQVRYYQSLLEVCETELASAMEANERSAGTVPKAEIARLEAQARAAKVDAENVRAAAQYLASAKSNGTATASPSKPTP